MPEYTNMVPEQSPIQRDIMQVVKKTSIGPNNNLMFPKTSSVTLLIGESKPLDGDRKPKV